MRHNIPLPRGWNRRAKSAVLHILALSHYAFTAMVARASNDRDRRTRRQAEIDRLNHELTLLQEELRIKHARMARTPLAHRLASSRRVVVTTDSTSRGFVRLHS